MEIARAGPDGEVQRRHGFEIVVEHVRLGRDHQFERAIAFLEEIGRQHLDGGGGSRGPDRADRSCYVGSAPVGQVVAVHRGYDHMLKPKRGNSLRHMRGLRLVQRARQAGFYIAEGAGARAGVAHDHHRGVALLPRSPMFGQPASSQTVCSRFSRTSSRGARIARRAGRLHTYPRRLALHWRIRTSSLCRMPQVAGATALRAA